MNSLTPPIANITFVFFVAAFTFYTMHPDGEKKKKLGKFKKWDLTPYKYSEIEEGEFLKTFEGRVYEAPL